MKIKLLFCFMVFQFAMLLGMESDKSGNEVIEGKICIVGKPFYSMDKIKSLNDIFGTTVGKDDPIVEVWIGSEKVPNWSTVDFTEFRKTHPKYQEYLKILSKLKILNNDVNKLIDDEQKLFQDVCDRKVPYFMPLPFFDGKKKKNTFILSIKIFDVPVKLKCTGVKDPNNWSGPMLPFHVGLQKLKKDFSYNPCWLEKEEERLVREGILVKNSFLSRWLTGKTYDHGPNSSIVKNQKN